MIIDLNKLVYTDKIEINEWSEIIEFATDRYVSRKQAKTG